MRPVVEVITRDAPSPRTPPTDTGVWFVTGLTEKGPADAPVAVRSMDAFKRLLGNRVSYSVLYDALDTFFREGGAFAYVGRVIGPAPVRASVSLSDGSADTLKVEAEHYGEYGNSLNVQVIAGTAGGTFRLVISDDVAGELERSPDLADTAAAIEWADASDNVRASELAGTGDPAVAAAASMTSGTDDRTNIVEAQHETALALFTRDLGAGQVSAPGRTTTTAHTDLLAHATTFNRTALLDGADTSTLATLTSAVTTQRTVLGDNEKHGGLFAPWVYIPGLVSGTRRTVPPSALVAGLIARSDASSDAGEAAAGRVKGAAQYAIGTRVVFTDSDHDTLNDGGVDVFRVRGNEVVLEGFRTMADPLNLPDDWQLSQQRALMQVVAVCEATAAPFLFAQIDGKRRKLAELESAVSGALLALFNEGLLFGDSPDAAYDADARSEDANPVEDLRQGIVKVLVSVRISPYAEKVQIAITKVPITEPVA